MTDLRSTPRWVRQPTEPQPWLTTRRGDLISLWGAAVVVLMVFAVLLVVAHDGGSDPADEYLPPLPFAGAPVHQPAAALPY